VHFLGNKLDFKTYNIADDSCLCYMFPSMHGLFSSNAIQTPTMKEISGNIALW
jgi:hypothetical protein